MEVAPVKDFSEISYDENEIAYLDSNIVYSLFSGSSLYVAENSKSIQYTINKLATSQSLLISSNIMRDELNAIIRKHLLKDYVAKNGRAHYKKIIQENPQILSEVSRSVNAIISQFEQLPGIMLTTNQQDLWYECESQIIENLHVENMDAKHLLAAKSAGAKYFITADSDFQHINDPELTIVLPKIKKANTPSQSITYTIPSNESLILL